MSHSAQRKKQHWIKFKYVFSSFKPTYKLKCECCYSGRSCLLHIRIHSTRNDFLKTFCVTLLFCWWCWQTVAIVIVFPHGEQGCDERCQEVRSLHFYSVNSQLRPIRRLSPFIWWHHLNESTKKSSKNSSNSIFFFFYLNISGNLTWFFPVMVMDEVQLPANSVFEL